MDSSNRLIEELRGSEEGLSPELEHLIGLAPTICISSLRPKEIPIPLIMLIEGVMPIMQYMEGFYPIESFLQYPFMDSHRSLVCLNGLDKQTLSMQDGLTIRTKVLDLGRLISIWTGTTAYLERVLLTVKGEMFLWHAEYTFQRLPLEKDSTTGRISDLRTTSSAFGPFSPKFLADMILNPQAFCGNDKEFNPEKLYHGAMERIHSSLLKSIDKKEGQLSSMRNFEASATVLTHRLDRL